MEWKTASENNNRGFEIERSIYSDNNAALNFEKAGFVAGNGTTSTEHSYVYIDAPAGGKKFMYRLKQIDTDGRYKYSETRIVILSGIKDKLYDAYPNPADAGSIIKYQLSKNSQVNIALFDLAGKKIKQLINTRQEEGIYQVTLKTDDLPAGTYFYKMTADKVQMVKKIVVQH